MKLSFGRLGPCMRRKNRIRRYGNNGYSVTIIAMAYDALYRRRSRPRPMYNNLEEEEETLFVNGMVTVGAV